MAPFTGRFAQVLVDGRSLSRQKQPGQHLGHGRVNLCSMTLVSIIFPVGSSDQKPAGLGGFWLLEDPQTWEAAAYNIRA